MKIVETVAEMRRIRAELSGPVAMGATLGGIHEGHEALFRRGRKLGESFVVSLFLNPTQFDDPSDLSSYPHDRERDLEVLARLGVDVVFAPTVPELYPEAGTGLEVDPGPIGTVLEGAHRPGHFRGVATVVAKILVLIRPDIAVWGAKDAQQNLIIRRVSAGLCLDVDHRIIPTVREDDGLAISSRNQRLGPAERQAAPVLYRGLEGAVEAWKAGTTDADALLEVVRTTVASEPLVRLEYVHLNDPETLEEVSDEVTAGALLSLAAGVGDVRLIDNVVLGVPGASLPLRP